MSSSLRTSLPFTLALAIIVYLVATFLPAGLFSQATALTLGVVIAGILVPLLVEYKPLPTTAAIKLQKATNATVSGDTATLYVGNLPYRANEEAVRELFQE